MNVAVAAINEGWAEGGYIHLLYLYIVLFYCETYLQKRLFYLAHNAATRAARVNGIVSNPVVNNTR